MDRLIQVPTIPIFLKIILFAKTWLVWWTKKVIPSVTHFPWCYRSAHLWSLALVCHWPRYSGCKHGGLIVMRSPPARKGKLRVESSLCHMCHVYTVSSAQSSYSVASSSSVFVFSNVALSGNLPTEAVLKRALSYNCLVSPEDKSMRNEKNSFLLIKYFTS